jgi:hypothetical protein
MPNESLAPLSHLSDADLIAQVKRLAARERDAMAQLIAHLAELEARDLHLKAGYGSLFAYCRGALALSEHETYNRIEAARAGRRFPVILDLLADGSVNLTTVRLLAPHLTADNHRAALDSARGKTKREVEEIVARLSPRPDAPSSIRKHPTTRPAEPAPAAQPIAPEPVHVPARPPVASHPSTTTPLAPDRYRLQLTIGGGTLEKLRLAKDMLSHAVPSGDDAAILDRALTALLADLAKQKFAATDKPHASGGTAPGSRHIPAEVKRAVWLRDVGRCAFVGAGERRCDERRFVEFHHVHPYAAGGEATIENIELRCRRHNDYEARVYFARGEPGGEGEVREAQIDYRANSFQNELARFRPAVTRPCPLLS